MAPFDTKPPFATYLLPSLPLSLPFRRRQSSATSTTSDAPSLSFSPRSSISSTVSPPSSPISNYAHYSIPNPFSSSLPQKGLLHEALQNDAVKSEEGQSSKERKLYQAQPNTLKCVNCATDIAFTAQIVSKGFTGRHGRAYLVGPPDSSIALNIKDRASLQPGMLINTKIGRNVNRELLTGAHVVADVSCAICSSVLGWKYVDAKELAQKYKIGKFILEMKRVVQAIGWEDGLTEERGNETLQDEIEKDGEENDAILFDEDDEDECEDLFAGVWNAEVVAKRRGRRMSRK